MTQNYRNALIEGLWNRLARYARGTASQRAFIVEELCHILSCTEVNREN